MSDAPDQQAAPAKLREPDEDSLRLAEALVFASAEPVSPRGLSRVLPDDVDADAVLSALRARYAGRGVELVEAGGGVMFRSALDLAPRLRKVIDFAPPVASGCDGDPGDRRLPPADDSAGNRAYPRHGVVSTDTGSVAGAEPDCADGTPGNTGPADTMGHDTGVFGAFRLERLAGTAPAGGSAAGDGFAPDDAGCGPGRFAAAGRTARA